MIDIQGALAAWIKVLSKKNVIIKRNILSEFETATFFTKLKILAVIYPTKTKNIQKCLKIANKFYVPVYPISIGKNWGYGSHVPVKNNCVVMDLSKMNKIIDFDEKLAYITVEPGVTFEQVYKFLHSKKSKLIMSVTGSSPYSSLIGNILERGVGKGRYGNRYQYACGMEIVLPNGECIHTGFARFNGAKTGQISRSGVGPGFDDMFIQSNLGVVTKMTIWLLPKPNYFQVFFYNIKEGSQLGDLIDALRVLKLEGTLEGNFLIVNDYRLLSFNEKYSSKNKGEQPLTLLELEKLKKSLKWGGAWNGEGALLSASKEQGISTRKRVQKLLKNNVSRLIFFDEMKAKATKILDLPLRLFTGIDLKKTVNDAFYKSTFLGIPTMNGINSIYWRKKSFSTKALNPDMDNCGILWIDAIAPFEGNSVSIVIQIMKKQFLRYGFEPNIGINCVTERSVYITGEILYDRNIKDNDKKAIKCYKKTFKELVKKGFIPNRLTVNSMDLLPSSNDDYDTFLHKLKKTIDPNNILSPGRYGIY